jgi:hypothetical protein
MAPNTRIDTPAGAKYHASLMGGNSSNIYIAVMESALRLAGTVHAFPEGMLTGSYQNANYASSLTAEAPFVQGRVAEQMHRAARVKEMFLKILKLACERGRFRHCGIEAWKDMAPGLNIEIQPAKVFPKNIKEMTDALVIQKAQGWVDDKSAMTELGRDYDAVRLQQSLEKNQGQQQPGAAGDPNAPIQPETASEQPSGIYSQISRQQWIRNGKAIQDVVGNLVNGTITPVLASVMLSTLGLDKETAQAIVDDVQSRGQESFQEAKKIRRSNLFESREQRKHRKLVEGGKGSGITGHRTDRQKTARKTTAKRSQPPHSDRVKRAQASKKIIGSDIQREADLKERAMAQKLKGVSFKNSEPVDIVVGNSSGVVIHGIEHKYMVDNGNSKITMNKYAQVRKVNWERSNKAAFHTVVESREGDIYYRRGVGSFRIGGMHQITGGHAELTKLLSTPDAALPAAARRTDGNIRVGVWKPTKDGPGFVNSKTGEVVRPKK